MTNLAPLDPSETLASSEMDTAQAAWARDERVEHLDHVATCLRVLRVNEVISRTAHECKVCGVEMPPGTPMIAQTLQGRKYTTTWYFCPFCPAPEPDQGVEPERMRKRIMAANEIKPTTSLDPSGLLEAYAASISPRSLAAYGADLDALAGFLGVETRGDVAREIVSGGPGEANRLVLAWRGAMLDAGLAPKTVNRRLSAVRSLLKVARLLGLIEWGIDVKGVRAKVMRDVRGLPWATYQERIANPDIPVRDLAMLRLMGDRGLRSQEARTLRVSDVEDDCAAVWVLPKGGHERERVGIYGETREALRAWLAERNVSRGWVFPGRPKSQPMTGDNLLKITRRWMGCKAHALRHTAGTHGASKADNAFALQAFMRHRDPKTTRVYIDNMEDLAGVVARRMHEEDTE